MAQFPLGWPKQLVPVALTTATRTPWVLVDPACENSINKKLLQSTSAITETHNLI